MQRHLRKGPPSVGRVQGRRFQALLASFSLLSSRSERSKMDGLFEMVTVRDPLPADVRPNMLKLASGTNRPRQCLLILSSRAMKWAGDKLQRILPSAGMRRSSYGRHTHRRYGSPDSNTCLFGPELTDDWGSRRSPANNHASSHARSDQRWCVAHS